MTSSCKYNSRDFTVGDSTVGVKLGYCTQATKAGRGEAWERGTRSRGTGYCKIHVTITQLVLSMLVIRHGTS